MTLFTDHFYVLDIESESLKKIKNSSPGAHQAGSPCQPRPPPTCFHNSLKQPDESKLAGQKLSLKDENAGGLSTDNFNCETILQTFCISKHFYAPFPEYGEKSNNCFFIWIHFQPVNFCSVFFEKCGTTQILNPKESTGENPKPSVTAEINHGPLQSVLQCGPVFLIYIYFIPTYEEKKIQKDILPHVHSGCLRGLDNECYFWLSLSCCILWLFIMSIFWFFYFKKKKKYTSHKIPVTVPFGEYSV